MGEKEVEYFVRLVALETLDSSYEARVQVQYFVSCYWVRCHHWMKGFDGTFGWVYFPVG